MPRTRTPYIALLPVLAGVFIAADDQTVVVTVLPRIMLDMEVPFTELDRASWTITGYLLGYVSAMPFIGRLSDILGRRRLYLWCMALFMAGSAVVAVTPTIEWLIGARVFQAMAAGALVPISIAIVSDLFPSGRRGLPLGLVGASAEAGGVIGPLWGGIITRFLDWQWVFWINIPLGAFVLTGILLLLAPGPVYRGRIDYVGGALVAAAIATLTLGLSRIDVADALMIAYLAASGVALALFVAWQRTASEPLLPPSMFRDWAFRGANVTHLLVGGALIIGMVTIPLMANTVLQLTPLDGGLRLMRLTAAIPVGAVLGGLACQRVGLQDPDHCGPRISRPWIRLHEQMGDRRRRSGDDASPAHGRSRIRSRDRTHRPRRDELGAGGGPGRRRRVDHGYAHGRDDSRPRCADRLGHRTLRHARRRRPRYRSDSPPPCSSPSWPAPE